MPIPFRPAKRSRWPPGSCKQTFGLMTALRLAQRPSSRTLSGNCTRRPLARRRMLIGAGSKVRTRDPLFTKQVLCHLSYAGVHVKRGRSGVNRTPDVLLPKQTACHLPALRFTGSPSRIRTCIGLAAIQRINSASACQLAYRGKTLLLNLVGAPGFEPGPGTLKGCCATATPYSRLSLFPAPNTKRPGALSNIRAWQP